MSRPPERDDEQEDTLRLVSFQPTREVGPLLTAEGELAISLATPYSRPVPPEVEEDHPMTKPVERPDPEALRSSLESLLREALSLESAWSFVDRLSRLIDRNLEQTEETARELRDRSPEPGPTRRGLVEVLEGIDRTRRLVRDLRDHVDRTEPIPGERDLDRITGELEGMVESLRDRDEVAGNGSSRGEPEGTILLLDRDESLRRLTRRILEDEGFRVLEVEDPGAALRRAERADRVDLLIAEVDPAGLDGQELVRSVHAAHPGAGVIHLAPFAAPEGTTPAGDGPRAVHLTKPFDVLDLRRAVEEVLAT